MKSNAIRGASWTLLAIFLPALLTGCGGSSSSTPAAVTPTTPPTVAITGTSVTAVSGPVTLTFTFSQPMSAFPAGDVVVTEGTAAASTTKVSPTVYTLVVTPAANASGSMTASLAVGAFTDTAGVANTVAAEATQPYDTNAVPTVAITGTSIAAATGPVTLTFTFSQPMSAFPASDVVVTGGTAAASTTRVSPTVYTLVVTPPANATGTMDINVASGAFTDAAGAASTTAADATQSFDTLATTPPTVTIGGTSTTPATGPVTLTFTFSQPMSAFPASDVVVAGGTAAASTTRISATQYSLVVTPTADTTGTLDISVAAGAFTDTAGVANTAAADATQPFNTVPAPTAPTVAITGTSTAAVTGSVTLTFTFSQPMSAFPAGDVVVTSGTAAASTTMVSTTVYTLVVTPAANSTGTMDISVAAGAFTDTAGVVNAVGASATQPYNTTGVTALSYAVIDFNSSLASGSGFAYLASDFNGESSVLTSTAIPAGYPSGGPVFLMTTTGIGTTISSGTTMSVGGSDSVGAMPFYATGGTTPQATTMKVVINAPAAGLPIHLKVENALNNGQSCETTATTTSAGWQTLTFDFSKPGLPNGDPTAALNPAFTYDKISIFPDFLNSPSAPLTFYLGPITFIGVSAPLAPPLAVVVPPTLGAPSSGAAAPTLAATSVISLLNSSGTYTNISIGDWNPNWGQSGSLAATAAGSATVMKLNLVAPNTYQGVNVSSTGGPGDPGVINVTGKATLHVSYWTPNGTNFTFTPIDAGDNEFPIASGTLTQNAWTDLDFPITNGGFDLKTVRQLKFVSSAAEIIYLDNIYFH